VKDQVPHPHKTKGKTVKTLDIMLYINFNLQEICTQRNPSRGPTKNTHCRWGVRYCSERL